MTNVIQQDFQTVTTDFPGNPIQLVGQVTAIDLTDPTENNERTSQIEVDDPFDVRVDWSFLSSVLVPFLGGSWIVTLFSDDIDGVGQLVSKLAGPVAVPVVPGQLLYSHTFNFLAPNTIQPSPEGLYQFAVTINHSTNGALNGSGGTEMIAFAESSPFQVVATPVEVGDN